MWDNVEMKKAFKKAIKKRKAVDATKSLSFSITKEHVKRAKCKDPEKCVIAQALQDSAIGVVFDGFHVGATIVKLVTGDKVVRYSTPAKLARALKRFDKTKKWGLPVGEYKLNPVCKSLRLDSRPRRWEKAKRNGGKQSVFKSNSLPSRQVIRVESLRDAA